jgi:hypothetical protein
MFWKWNLKTNWDLSRNSTILTNLDGDCSTKTEPFLTKTKFLWLVKIFETLEIRPLKTGLASFSRMSLNVETKFCSRPYLEKTCHPPMLIFFVEVLKMRKKIWSRAKLNKNSFYNSIIQSSPSKFHNW